MKKIARRDELAFFAEANATAHAALILVEQLLIESVRDRADPAGALADLRDRALARTSSVAANAAAQPHLAAVERTVSRVIELAQARFQRKH